MPTEKDLLPYDVRRAFRKSPFDRILLPCRGIRIVTISPQDYSFGKTVAKAQASHRRGRQVADNQATRPRQTVRYPESRLPMSTNIVSFVGFDTMVVTKS